MTGLSMDKIRYSMVTITLAGGALAIALLRTGMVTNLQALSVMLGFVAGSYLLGTVLVRQLGERIKNRAHRPSNHSSGLETLTGPALVPALIVAALLTGILLLHLHTRNEEIAWQQYVVEHGCRIVATYRHGNDKEQWLCSDGVAHFR